MPRDSNTTLHDGQVQLPDYTTVETSSDLRLATEEGNNMAATDLTTHRESYLVTGGRNNMTVTEPPDTSVTDMPPIYYFDGSVLIAVFMMTHRNVVDYIVNAIIVFLGLVGNMLVILILVKYASLRKQATNVLILSQCVVDFISALILGLMLITEILDIYGVEWVTLSDSNVLSHVWCAWWQSHDLVRAVFRVSTFNLIVITLERYLGICHPFVHIKHVTTNIVRASIALTWVLGAISVFSFSHWGARVRHGKCTWVISVYQMDAEISVMVICQYLLPVPLFIIMYTMIVRKLAAKHKENSGGDGSHKKYNDVMDAAKKNTIKMLITVVVLYIICWTCLMVYFSMLITQFATNKVFLTISEILMFVNCCCNPFIYIFRSENYRSKIKELFCKPSPEASSGITASSKIDSEATV